MNLKGRLEKLEAVAPDSKEIPCMVAHHTNCAEDRAKAVDAYRAAHGHDPADFIDILFVSPETKQSICGCPLNQFR